MGSRGGDEYSKSTITELITYNRQLSLDDLHLIESYLAIKYGITLGANGTSKNYNATNNTVVWNASSNSGYAYDIAGIGRDDATALNQRKSHSINGPEQYKYSDILTIANGDDFENPSDFSDDISFFLWGHNNEDIKNSNISTPINIQTTNGENIVSIIDRKWKAQETGNVGELTLQFDLSEVPGTTGLGDNNMVNIRLLISNSGNFTSGILSVVPSSVDNINKIVYFNYDFTSQAKLPGFYFTLGSVDIHDSPLPVELISFTANCNKREINLDWITASEINNDYFVVERSKDGIKWQNIGKIAGNGNSNTTNSYQYTDKNPEQGNNYYRLNQFDYDKTAKHSHIITANCDKLRNSNNVNIYPNPFTNQVYLEIENLDISTMSIEIYDLLGQKHKHWAISEINANFVHELNLEELASGVYFIRIIADNNIIIKKIEKK